MPLRFQNVCRHRQTNNTGRLPPILTPHALFSHFPAPLLSNFPAFPENLLPAVSCRPAPHTLFPHLSCRASFKLSRLSRKSPAGRLPPILAPHTLFSHFPAPLLSNFPAFPENLLPAVFRRSSHRTRCFLTFPAALLSNFPAFPENLLPAVFRRSSHCTRCFLTFLPRFSQVCLPFPKISCRPFHAAPHRTRCFLAFRSCSPLPCLTFSYHHFKSSPSPSPHNSFLNLSQHSK